jgi:hypothetical protein
MPESKSVVDPITSTLTDEGLDEAWLERWLQENPTRLGLGPRVRIVRAQIIRPAGATTGRLDLQAVDESIEDRVYDIELMRGELDADHGFRALDYWAREQRADDQDREHRPVIVAERVRGSRYWVLLEALAEKLGLLALEVRCLRVGDSPVIWLEPVLIPEDLRPDGQGGIGAAKAALTETDWRAKTTEEFQQFVTTLRSRFQEWGLRHEVNWSVKSYIGLWKGSRCWCPIWPRKEAAGRLYLPAPPTWGEGDSDSVPSGFELRRAELAKLGIELAWTWRYNAGANPVGVTLTVKDLDRPEVRTLLEETWKALP